MMYRSRRTDNLKMQPAVEIVWPIEPGTVSGRSPKKRHREINVHKFSAVLRYPGAGERQF
jgi:hypothetical protein